MVDFHGKFVGRYDIPFVPWMVSEGKRSALRQFFCGSVQLSNEKPPGYFEDKGDDIRPGVMWGL